MTQPGCENALIFLVSRIKQSANAAGIRTCRDMSLASGVSKSGVDKIYNLRSYPCFDTLLAMAAACGTTVHAWTENLEQDSDSKGQRAETKAERDERNAPDPRERKDETEAAEPEKTEAAEAAEESAHDQPEDKPENSDPSGFVDVVALLKGANPNQL